MYLCVGWDNLTAVSLLLILAPVAVWYVMVADHLEQWLAGWMVALVALLTLWILLFMLLSTFTEPGKLFF